MSNDKAQVPVFFCAARGLPAQRHMCLTDGCAPAWARRFAAAATLANGRV